jgi:hypothetical protein
LALVTIRMRMLSMLTSARRAASVRRAACIMTLSSPHLRRFVKRALADATDAVEPNAAQLVSAFTSLCTRLRQRLQPLFGTTAVTALFARARHVATQEFPWLADVVEQNNDGCSPDAAASAHAFDEGCLADGLAAVLAHNIGLLSTFVGEDLVLPLVREAWGTAMPAEEQPGSKVINE